MNDTLVVACGYERRSSALVPLASQVPNRIALCFKEHTEALDRKRNEAVFIEAGFRLTDPVSGSDGAAMEVIFAEVFRGSRAVAVDISSMTRAWHGAAIRAFRHLEKDRVDAFFFYAPSLFSMPPEQNSPIEAVKPLEGFASFSSPTKPVALLIGLGYERDRAVALQELLDPRRTVLMIPNSGLNDPFYRSVLESNKEIVQRTTKDWTFEYPLHDPLATYRILESVCLGLETHFRIVLASLGPKLFALICLLLAVENSDLSVWSVTSGSMAEPRDAVADMTRSVVLRTSWCSPEIVNDPSRDSSQEARVGM